MYLSASSIISENENLILDLSFFLTAIIYRNNRNKLGTMKDTLQNMAYAILYGILFLISLFPMKLLYGITAVLGVALYRIV